MLELPAFLGVWSTIGIGVSSALPRVSLAPEMPNPLSLRCALSRSLSLPSPPLLPARSTSLRLILSFLSLLAGEGTPSTPSHCICPASAEPELKRLLGEAFLLLVLPAPKLCLALALFPLNPSSLRSIDAVVSSSIPDQPSWVPRRSECATAAFGGE